MSELWAWVDDLTATGPIQLSAEEARHVVARRLRVGDSLVVFDGRGRWADALLEAIGKKSTVLEIGSIRKDPRPDFSFVLASAIPKGDRLGTMLQMLTQLGLEVWQPLVFEDSVQRRLDRKSARLNRILIESCKVARRPWRLEVLEPCTLDALLDRQSREVEIFFGDRKGDSEWLAPTDALAVIGPEAGFNDRERRALEKVGARPRAFASHNLRIETAAVAATTAYNLGRNGSGSR